MIINSPIGKTNKMDKEIGWIIEYAWVDFPPKHDGKWIEIFNRHLYSSKTSAEQAWEQFPEAYKKHYKLIGFFPLYKQNQKP